MKITIAVELDFINNLIDWDDQEQKDWLLDEILPSATIAIYSEEVGDYITEPKTLKTIRRIYNDK